MISEEDKDYSVPPAKGPRTPRGPDNPPPNQPVKTPSFPKGK